MKLEFKPKDFSEDFVTTIAPHIAANMANQKLERYMKENAKLVTPWRSNTGYEWHEIQLPPDSGTVGYVINISEIPKKECEHHAPIYVLDHFIKSTDLSPGKVGFDFFKEKNWECHKCGAKLKANWTVCE